MKIIYFILSLIPLLVFAQSTNSVKIDIGVDGNRVKLKCDQESTNLEIDSVHYDIYSCSKKGKKYYIRKIHEYSNYSGFEFDPKSKEFKSVAINEISRGSETIYKSIFISNAANDLARDDESLLSKFEYLNNFRNNYNEIFGADTILSSKEVRELQTEARLALLENTDEIQKAYGQNDKLTLTTQDGKKVNCERGKERTCLQYICTGLAQKVLLRNVSLYGTSETPYLVSYDQNGLGQDLSISEISLNGKLYYKNTLPNYDSGSSFLPEDLKKSERTYRILTDPVTKILRKDEIKACHDPKLSQFEKELQEQVKRTEERLQETKLVELIENVDGIFKSRAISAKEVSSKMCHMGGDVYYYDKDNYLNNAEKDFYGFSPEGRVVPKSRLDEIFKFAIAQKDIPYAYYKDGCFARAHTLCYRLEEQLGIDTEKIWARGPVSPPNDESMTWNYHVAPRINIQEADGRIQGYVIDPSVANRPLKEEEWLEIISTNKKTAQMRTTWPPFIATGAVRNIQVSYSPNEIYGFYQKTETLTPDIIKEDKVKALETNEMYRSYLDEEN